MGGALRRGALVLWPAVALVVASSFGWGAIAQSALAVTVAVALPMAFSWSWGRLWRLGALGGVALLFFTVQAVLVLIALGLYLSVEWLVERLFVTRSQRNPVLTRHL